MKTMTQFTRACIMTLAAGGVLSSAALADTLFVPAQFPTIQDAINAAADGDTIVVAPGSYFENIDFLSKSIAVTSSGGNGVTTIDGSVGFTSTVNIVATTGTATLSGFTVIAGPGQADPFNAVLTSGGGVFAQEAVVEIDGCIIRDANTSGRGGGAHFFDSDVVVSNSVFTNNISDAANANTVRGGGVAVSGSLFVPTVIFNSTVFSNNSAGNNGGGVSVFASSAVLNDCEFTSNAAGVGGGGLHVLVGDVQVNNTSFSSNTAVNGGGVHMNTDATGVFTTCSFDANTSLPGTDTKGGAFYALGTANTDPNGEIVIQSSTFTNNIAIGVAGQGGALYLTRGTTVGDAVARVLDSSFTANSAENRGGAAYVVFTQPVFDGCAFDANTCDLDGGAFYWSSGGGGLIANSTFTNNTAVGDGGGIRTLRGVGRVENCFFDGNTAQDDGGSIGLFSSTAGPSEVELVGVTILNGSAGDAGGGIYSLRNNIIMENCEISGNQAFRGGGMATFGNTNGGTVATITNTIISNNTAEEFSGGLGVSGSLSNINADRLTITNNTATFIDAGGVVATAGILTLANSLIADNTGSTFGGSAISLSGAELNIINSTLYGNTNSGATGAISFDGPLTIDNSIIWNNDGPVAVDVVTATVSNSIVSGGFAGVNNLDTDPLLVSPGTGDYSLSSNSPAIDAGDNAAAAGYALDLAGNARVSGASVDMGAFEFQSTAQPCVGDIADDFGTIGADGQVSFGDFLALLGLIGPCPGGNPGCIGDIADDFGTVGGDGQVSFGDFLALLGLIGPCP